MIKWNRLNCGFLQHNRDQMDVVWDLHKASDPELDFTGNVCSSLHHQQPLAQPLYHCLCQVLLHVVWYCANLRL